MSTLVTATVKSNSSSPVAFQNSSGTEIGTMCRAWVNFNGTGTVAIRAQFNVSSITDNGTGDSTVNFTTAMVDANYAFTISGYQNTTGGGSIAYGTGQTYTTSAVRVKTVNLGTADVDMQNVSVAIFR
jgi:hypothetical protein